MNTTEQGAAATPLALLDSKTITKLCDSAMYAFTILHQLEMRQRKINKTKLKGEVDKIDLFGCAAHYADVEEYQPEEQGRY